jgi:hypothetical protein
LEQEQLLRDLVQVQVALKVQIQYFLQLYLQVVVKVVMQHQLHLLQLVFKMADLVVQVVVVQE